MILKFNLAVKQKYDDKNMDLPDFFDSIRNNFVDKKKSKVTMQFDYFLYISFYKQIYLFI